MALDEYKRKRKFQKTPEPPPATELHAGFRFVVQKHRASRLHYDFRLEMEGVLKSWAVPKGPSLDPAEKRLAMMVEDHPVSYLHFEGIIPPGNYGAGTVMVWDTGTWEPLGEAAAMLEKGDLKFNLQGQKLRGSFVLARMRSRRPGSKGNEWLLIKHRDPYVVTGYDIDKYDWSVLTRRSLEEIAQETNPAEWQSNRPAAQPAKNGWLAGTLVQRHKRSAPDAVPAAMASSASSSGPEPGPAPARSQRRAKTSSASLPGKSKRESGARRPVLNEGETGAGEVRAGLGGRSRGAASGHAGADSSHAGHGDH
jgi:bifunctional non-homologous end joining protein LigD